MTKEEQKDQKRVLQKNRNIYEIIIAAIRSCPTFGAICGMATSAGWYMENPPYRKISSTILGFTLTKKDELYNKNIQFLYF